MDGDNTNKVDFLMCFKSFTEKAIKDLLLPVKQQKENDSALERASAVHCMRLPNSRKAETKAPYILHQIVTGVDEQHPQNQIESTTTVRSIFCVYCDDEEKGGIHLLNLMERVRIALLQEIVISEKYELDISQKLEMLVYPDDTAPYFVGEMMSTWILPPVKRITPELW